MFPERLRNLCLLTMDEARERRVRIATAESCTGGLIASLFTEFSGSSDVFERGFVTYSNRSKEEVLGVPGDLIADYGAVSEAVARLMAEGALEASRANLAVAVTGVAGPGGGTPMKPVGTVHIACARENKAVLHEACYFGDLGRHEVRMATIEAALNMIRQQIP
ncbi:MAG: damage-inducible protein CinA [Henriciella sp.]|jgi:nicotinamide-nucleotide amidase|uniref:CinA family protein n=1 Tax=Henriciella sp. TaxID=1968823 RepID=UPI000C10A900|nr:CinA family protein [Henriciella sp.]MAN75277.1 damage-inducible protein CinA [Henriciella sp.]MBF33464.1 damage-inducible protein CinA [Hyphomonadaceae bacterium]PHR79880.1 MAG: damage-inducible protein CinA [Henriciella sp.]|tara:strand:- start:91 stop:582 length:492 start_codon:yes stop_codon:yes gene_type:complete